MLPFMVKADMAAPVAQYHVRVSNPNGAIIYEYDSGYRATEKKVDYDKICKVNFEYDEYITASCDDENKYYTLSVSDVSPLEINLSDYKHDQSLKYYVFDKNVLFDILKNVLDEGAVRARTVKFKLKDYVRSTKLTERAYALNMIASDGAGIEVVPPEDKIGEVLEDTVVWISEEIAKRYVQNQIESKVEKAIMEKQEKYIDEMRLSIIKKEKGSENQKTEKKYEELKELDSRVTSKNIMSFLRPETLDEIVGQERAIKSLISKSIPSYFQYNIH